MSYICTTNVIEIHDRILIAYTMNTKETAQMTKTPYFIEYVYSKDSYGQALFYYQLVRTSDLAILYANAIFDKVVAECWSNDISKRDVTIW